MKQIIFLLTIILLSTNFVYSKGLNETGELARAEALIAEKKYDEAIRVLTAYSLENPASIYETQNLLDEIRVEREKINNLMDDLITAIYDEEDFEKGDRIINEIKDLNPNPDQLSKLFLRNARNAATFVVNKKKFKELMDQALDNLSRDEYGEALDKYLQCLDFHRDEFDLLMDEYSNDSEPQNIDFTQINEDLPVNSYYTSLKNSSFSEVESIVKNTIDLKEFLIRLNSSYNLAIEELDKEDLSPEDLREGLEVFKEVPLVLDNYGEIYSKLDQYNDLFSKITVDGSRSNFITYASLVLSGRDNQDEGILYIINLLYPKYIDGILTRIGERIDSDLTSALTAYKVRDSDSSVNYFNKAEVDLTALNYTASLWKSFIKVDSNFNIQGESILKEKYPYLGDSIVGQGVITTYRDLISIKDELDNNSSFMELSPLRSYIVSKLDSLQSLIDKWQRDKTEIDSRVLLSYNKSPGWVTDLINELDTFNRELKEREVAIVDTQTRESYRGIFGFDYSQSDGESDPMASLIAKAAEPTDRAESINIYFDINNTDERTLTTYNPEESLKKLNTIEEEYEGFINGLRQYLSTYGNEKSYIVSTVNFSSRYSSVEEALALATVNRETLISYKERAQSKITLSSESENRGFTLYTNAVNAFNKESFNEAREYIETAKGVAVTSISYSKNRRVIEDLIPSLYNLNNDIGLEEARIVIRDVRRLITEGKTKYLEGAYIPASDLFKEAELRWSETNTDDHPEIPYWLALIKDAMAIESGRYLNVTEPLYNILAGYLSYAETYFRKGVDEENKVNKLKAFAVADSYLLKVLEVRPLNERARFLQLQVLKSKDPDSFKETFNNDFIRYRNSVIQALEGENVIETVRIIPILESYEAIITDAYRLNPRLSNSNRRKLLERFYQPISTAGKTAAQLEREREDNDNNRKIINESYTRFKDLYRIAESDQIGDVERVINICEVALGFRRLPVDTSNIRESNQIFLNARRSLEGTDKTETDKLNSILSDLQRAFTLNPENEEIPVVIDDILVMLGEESNFQLAPAEDRIFREAQKDFIDGNYFEARDKIIQILRADSRNKNYPKLKELINRVEIKLKVEITI